MRSCSLCLPGTNESDEAEDDEDNNEESVADGELLVGSVIEQLEVLARHIRKVSLPPGVTPAPVPVSALAHHSSDSSRYEDDSGSQQELPSSRDSLHLSRLSLKTNRDCLQQQQVEALSPSPNHPNHHQSSSPSNNGTSFTQCVAANGHNNGNSSAHSGFLAQIYASSNSCESADSGEDSQSNSHRRSVIFTLPTEIEKGNGPIAINRRPSTSIAIQEVT